MATSELNPGIGSVNDLVTQLNVALSAALIALSTACAKEPSQTTIPSENQTIASMRTAANAQEVDSPLQSNHAHADVQALVNLGPRVTGTAVMQQASAYLIEEYRKAGYVTQVQPFTYEKFEDQGSRLTVNGVSIQGRALNGSIAGQPTARLVAVPNLGKPADFAAVNVKGAIALVKRGEIPFAEKARNAVAAGAIGVVIVNHQSGEVFGTLGSPSTIPVLAVSRQAGERLLQQAQKDSLQASLSVNTQKRTVTGRNIIAHQEGVTQPKLILGGHYDSVAGSPGANDNASGTAVVLAVARQLSSTPIARQAWFIAFDGEEDGLQGSQAFVSSAQPSFLSRLKAMLNFDMVGVNDRLGIGGTASLTALAKKTSSAIDTFGSHSGSDHASFNAKGVPVLFFYRGQEPNYHSPKDAGVNPTLLHDTTQTAVRIVRRILEEG